MQKAHLLRGLCGACLHFPAPIRHGRQPWALMSAKNAHRNYSVVCAGAGRAAHLAGMCASLTKIPVIGVPIKDKKTDGISALFSVSEMPRGIPVATTAINGALNAGLLAISIIALQDKKVRIKLENYRVRQTKSVKKRPR